MVSQRRRGSQDSVTRTRLLDTATELMRVEGHTAVTARRLAGQVGLKLQIVHYYFKSMEELYLAVVKRSCEGYLKRQEEALEGTNPLRTVWELVSFPDGIRLEIEFMSLASHFESVRRMIADYQLRSREMQAAAVDRFLKESGADLGELTAEGLMLILRSVARAIVMETNVGLTIGHDQALSEIERRLSQFDPESLDATGTQG